MLCLRSSAYNFFFTYVPPAVLPVYINYKKTSDENPPFWTKRKNSISIAKKYSSIMCAVPLY